MSGACRGRKNPHGKIHSYDKNIKINTNVTNKEEK
jgi:hypothetical protein